MNNSLRHFAQRLPLLVSALLAGLFLSGCASTKVSDRQQFVTGPLPKPDHIWVYPFASNASDIPADSMLAGQPDVYTPPQTPQQAAEGTKLGRDIANELVADIVKLGKPAMLANAATKPAINDIVIRGYLVSVDEGSAAKRVAIGFGSGASELKVAVEGFQMTATGLRKLGSGSVQAEGGKTPGMSLGAASWLVTSNPAGLIVSGGMKAYGEASGSATVDGRAKAVAEKITEALKKRFETAGWNN